MIIEINGSKVEISDRSSEYDPPNPGELYIVKASSGTHLLTCKKVGRTPDSKFGLVFPEEKECAYELHICYKVIDIK